jgi:hypothetical protein
MNMKEKKLLIGVVLLSYFEITETLIWRKNTLKKIMERLQDSVRFYDCNIFVTSVWI